MSRIGRKHILIPENVEIKIEGQRIIVKGPKGELSRGVRPELGVEIKDDGKMIVSIKKQVSQAKALWGLF